MALIPCQLYSEVLGLATGLRPLTKKFPQPSLVAMQWEKLRDFFRVRRYTNQMLAPYCTSLIMVLPVSPLMKIPASVTWAALCRGATRR